MARMSAAPRISVVGIGADGWAGLGEAARAAILAAGEIVGSPRQLALLPPHATGNPRAWPSPLDALLDELAEDAGPDTCVLASGDPMLHGIGATLARRLGPQRLDVHPHTSAFALACARLGWPQADVELVSAVARVPDVVARALAPGRRVVVLATGRDGAAQVVVIDCRAAPGTTLLQRSPGLPDDAYATTDGQLTKRHVRAMTLAALQPLPGQLLWDLGAASGSIAIEWLRAEPSARAIAIERRADRAAQAASNALALGVPQLDVRTATAPAAYRDLPEPDAIFVGGGLTTEDLVARAWAALRPGGRIVANAVTLEGEAELVVARARFGGTLTRVEIAHAEPLGALTGWRAQMAVVQWAATKP
jgi:precorrin-6Y C5,15-methyltransferase (decarboxylating)